MAQQNTLLSIIIPVHNETENLQWHYQKITDHLKKSDYNYELIYVDDGSRDNSLEIIKQLSTKDSCVHYVSFSRNFGKEPATTAGLRKAKGDVALIIDADGQHPIEMLEQFMTKWREGYPVTIGVRSGNSGEGFTKKYGSKLFYKILNTMGSATTIPGSTDFRLIDRKVIDQFNLLTEHARITRGLIDWLGFKYATIEFQAQARHSGNASYDFKKLVKLAFSAFVSQTTKPLQFTGILGGFVMLASALSGIFLAIEKYVFGDAMHLAITGSAILAIFVSFLVGVVLTSNWLLALYIENIHNETQNRPLYVIDEEL